MSDARAFGACPIPIDRYPVVTLAHGGGGRLGSELVSDLFAAAFGSARPLHDGATFTPPAGRLAVTTDAFVMQPLAVPGCSLGALAAYGTMNDLAMCGARPLLLTASFILEEGLEMTTLWREACALAGACREVGVRVVAGDTKVVERGKGDGLFVSTTGVGAVAPGAEVSPLRVREGDAVLVSGDLGRHGIAVMMARDAVQIEGAPSSDCGSLVAPALALLDADIDVHCMRDLTRGGLASALHEIARDAGVSVRLDDAGLRVSPAVGAACELFGLDALHVANEGRFVAFVAESDAARALEVLRSHEISREAARAGRVGPSPERPGLRVTARGPFGTERVVDWLAGEQLPRIC